LNWFQVSGVRCQLYGTEPLDGKIQIASTKFQINPKSQQSMTETVQTKKCELLYFLMPMPSSHNLGRDQTGRWATSDPPDAEHLTPET
jgi:hypothetical protein